ncbi:hypothetical protein CHS0354_012091 [Potamilus streckersoni]|uniref:Replication protein A3 n=1 Tax=Potamilus streckersoni TaxID=2493646 RepID=A0AAE0VT41_9BIVA|nr:hypothetical protein CHS0354_012091 [Potamilus streckersoni]
MTEDFIKPRINFSMLTKYRGREVCVLGIGKQVDNNGTSFILSTSDNQEVKVIMQEPLNEYVSGLTEVHGQVDQRNQIICHNYINFPKEVSDNFDINLYNDAVELMSRLPEHYITGVPEK